MTEITLHDGRRRRINRLIVPFLDGQKPSDRWQRVVLPPPEPGFRRLVSHYEITENDPRKFMVTSIEDEIEPGSGQAASESLRLANQAIAIQYAFLPPHPDGYAFPTPFGHMPLQQTAPL